MTDGAIFLRHRYDTYILMLIAERYNLEYKITKNGHFYLKDRSKAEFVKKMYPRALAGWFK